MCTVGIHCNVTLIFSLVQAAACAEGGVTLISPFVGRITDWHKAKSGVASYAPEEDPGIQSVRRIYGYLKRFKYATVVMGASFRSAGQVLALAGCDKLTISPPLLEELKTSKKTFDRQLSPSEAASLYTEDRLSIEESAFRFALNEDAMATEKLAEGVRLFSADITSLEGLVKTRFAELEGEEANKN